MAKKRLELSPIKTMGIGEVSKGIQAVLNWLSKAERENHQSPTLTALQIQAAKNLTKAVWSLVTGNFQAAQKMAKVALAAMDQLKD